MSKFLSMLVLALVGSPQAVADGFACVDSLTREQGRLLVKVYVGVLL